MRSKYIFKTQLLSVLFAIFAHSLITFIVCTRFLDKRNLMLVLIMVVPLILAGIYAYISYKRLDGSLSTSLFVIFPNLLYLYIINKIIRSVYLRVPSHVSHMNMRFYIVGLMLILISWISVILGVFIGTSLKISKMPELK